MKKLFLILLLVVGVFNINATSNSQQQQKIDFNKKTTPGLSRAPALNPVSFSGTVYMDMLILTAQNYTGTVQVQITGAGGLTYSFYAAGAAVENIPLNTLPAGNYTVSVITESSGTFTGTFVL